MTETTASPTKRPALIAIAAFLLLILLAVAFLIPKLHHQRALSEEAEVTSEHLPVRTVQLKLGPAHTTIELPGTVQAFEQTPIYARTSGYVLKRLVDIGDHVSKGQLLAVIQDPTTEQALRQAQATVVQMKAQLALQQANAKLSSVNNQRWQQLRKAGVVSQVDADERSASAGANDAAVEAARANIAAAEANVRSLQEQRGFSRVTAPFSGTILSRSIDNGSLISSGSQNSVTQMFTIGQSGRVRVFTSVPQSMAPAIQNARSVKITFRELPGQVFSGTVARTSNSIDPASRTMLTEVDLDNPGGKILPGMFATVAFDSASSVQPVLLPQNALVMRSAGPQAVLVGADHVAHFQRLTLGRDLGTSVEVLSGLKPGDQVVVNPGDEVVENRKVEPQLQP